MSYLRSLEPDAGLLQIFQAFPEIARPLLQYHEALLRGESPFSPGERELIAAYVSDLNMSLLPCRSFTNSSRAWDRGEHDCRDAFELAVRICWSKNPAGTRFCAIFEAGWTDRALHDAAAICGLFNLMNRLVDGLGIEASEAYTKIAAQRLAEQGYAQLADLLPQPK